MSSTPAAAATASVAANASVAPLIDVSALDPVHMQLYHTLGMYIIYGVSPEAYHLRPTAVNTAYTHVLQSLAEHSNDIAGAPAAIAKLKRIVTAQSMIKDKDAALKKASDEFWPQANAYLAPLLEEQAKKYRMPAADFKAFCASIALEPSEKVVELAKTGGNLESSFKQFADTFRKLSRAPTAQAGMAYTIARLYDAQQDAKKNHTTALADEMLAQKLKIDLADVKKVREQAQQTLEKNFPSTESG